MKFAAQFFKLSDGTGNVGIYRYQDLRHIHSCKGCAAAVGQPNPHTHVYFVSEGAQFVLTTQKTPEAIFVEIERAWVADRPPPPPVSTSWWSRWGWGAMSPPEDKEKP